jgi:protein-disulfide isomerase
MRQRLSAALLATVLLGTACSVSAQTPPLIPARGPSGAAIVLMVFEDLASADAAKGEAVLTEIRKQFPNDVQLVFKHNPSSDGDRSALVHEAAVEAARQGKFWEMYDRLLAHRDELQAADLAEHAKAVGLDAAAFGKALADRTHRAIVERDMAEARALGIDGPFLLFINGRRANGVPPVQPLANLIKNLAAGGDGSGPVPVTPSTFDLTQAPTRGPATAPVTLVLFSDFQCGFCQRVNPTVNQLLQKYPEKVRLVFKHLPIEGHTLAPLAHRAALAAGEQGKFWEMHDRIFANQRAMSREDLLGHAAALGLDVPTFTATMDAERTGKLVDRDVAEAEKVGIDGTPTFFVNGKPLVGAQPLEAFTAAVDAALAAPAPR